jgi:hypothetical protein
MSTPAGSIYFGRPTATSANAENVSTHHSARSPNVSITRKRSANETGTLTRHD